MWLLLAFLSATLLGFYDVFKKKALKDNAVLPVLFFNTLFSSLIFLPFILLSAFAPGVLEGTMLDVPVVGWEVHKFIIIKSFIVLSSWILGYFGMKHLPITIVGPINATRPVMVLVGCHAGIWRALESLSVDRRDVGHYFFFYAESFGEEGRY